MKQLRKEMERLRTEAKDHPKNIEYALDLYAFLGVRPPEIEFVERWIEHFPGESLQIDHGEDKTCLDFSRNNPGRHRFAHMDDFPGLIIKYGLEVELTEAKVLRYIKNKTSIGVPSVLAAGTTKSKKYNYIVMEDVPGKTLLDEWPTLGKAEKKEVTKQMKQFFAELRTLEPPGRTVFGGLVRGPLKDDYFYFNGKQLGPFQSESDLKTALLKVICADYETQRGLMTKLFDNYFNGHVSTFTHGQIECTHIIVRRKHVPSRKEGTVKGIELTFVDWEYAGWYPEYWEFCTAMLPFCSDDWLDLLQETMPKLYLAEFLVFSRFARDFVL